MEEMVAKFRRIVLLNLSMISCNNLVIAITFDQFRLELSKGIENTEINSNIVNALNNLAVIELVLNQKLYEPYFELVQQSFFLKHDNVKHKLLSGGDGVMEAAKSSAEPIVNFDLNNVDFNNLADVENALNRSFQIPYSGLIWWDWLTKFNELFPKLHPVNPNSGSLSLNETSFFGQDSLLDNNKCYPDLNNLTKVEALLIQEGDAYQQIITQELQDKQNKLMPQQDCFFKKWEYEHFLGYIKRFDDNVYHALVQCKNILGRACIQKVSNIDEMGVFPPQDATHGYAIMKMPILTGFLSLNNPDEAKIVRSLIGEYGVYGDVLPIKERERVLELIKQLAPGLYERFLLADSIGLNHIRKGYGTAAVSYSPADGWPLIKIGRKFMEESFGVQLFIIGHEIGHYVLGHPKDDNKLVDFTNPTGGVVMKNGLKDAFVNANRRVKEYEADHFSVVKLGSSAENALAWMQKAQLDDHGTVSTFGSTHPLWKARIEHMLSLAREVEIQQRHPAISINWAELATDYKAWALTHKPSFEE